MNWRTWTPVVTTLSTLTCCALPILFVTLGMGSTLATVYSAVPYITELSKYKDVLFVISFWQILIALHWATKAKPCDGPRCEIAPKKRWEFWVAIICMAVWMCAAAFAYILPASN